MPQRGTSDCRGQNAPARERASERKFRRACEGFSRESTGFDAEAQNSEGIYIYVTFEKTYHAEENLITQGRAPCIILSPLPNLLLSLPSLQARKSAHTRTCPLFPSQCEKSSMSGSEGHGTLTQQATASYHFPGPEDLCF